MMTPKLNIPGRLKMQPGHAALIGLGVSLVWAYWITFGRLIQTWARDPQYSHGYLVPLFAAVLLWLRRDRLAAVSFRFSWWGVPFLAAAGLLRLAGTYWFISWLDALSLLLCLVGITVVLGEWAALRWAWPAIGFLGFMLPLPYQLQVALGQPLQRIATVASTYTLQTLGLPAIAEGNVIVLGELRIGIVEACNGLSMLVIFFAISTAVAMLIQRPRWEKAVIVASAIPIAVLANIARIVATALLNEYAGGGVAHAVFHDWSGWLMMSLALAILWGEMALLSCLLSARETRQPLAID
jgi:exosortase